MHQSIALSIDNNMLTMAYVVHALELGILVHSSIIGVSLGASLRQMTILWVPSDSISSSRELALEVPLFRVAASPYLQDAVDRLSLWLYLALLFQLRVRVAGAVERKVKMQKEEMRWQRLHREQLVGGREEKYYQSIIVLISTF